MAMKFTKIVLLAAFAALPNAPAHAIDQNRACRFDLDHAEFEGTPIAQARCLLSHVGTGGALGAPLKKLPAPLQRLVGRPVKISVAQLRAYLAAHDIAEADIGGDLDVPLPQTLPWPNGKTYSARYFVIHDTSEPFLGDAPEWPENMESPDWIGNHVEKWQLGEKSVAHVFTARDGHSITTVDFGTGWRATKFESRIIGDAARGLFLHIENEQPRRSDPAGPPGNDWFAPVPGFPPAQIDRLAVVYVAASVRAGVWLIPAQHGVIDSGIPDGHDDPQNFDLAAWARALDGVLKEISPSPLGEGGVRGKRH